MNTRIQSSEAASPAGSRTALDILAWLIQDAFEGDPSHSLLANLRELRDEDWTALPPGAGRCVADILEHVAWSKWMYEDYAFGSAALRPRRGRAFPSPPGVARLAQRRPAPLARLRACSARRRRAGARPPDQLG